MTRCPSPPPPHPPPPPFPRWVGGLGRPETLGEGSPGLRCFCGRLCGCLPPARQKAQGRDGRSPTRPPGVAPPRLEGPGAFWSLTRPFFRHKGRRERPGCPGGRHLWSSSAIKRNLLQLGLRLPVPAVRAQGLRRRRRGSGAPQGTRRARPGRLPTPRDVPPKRTGLCKPPGWGGAGPGRRPGLPGAEGAWPRRAPCSLATG